MKHTLDSLRQKLYYLTSDFDNSKHAYFMKPLGESKFIKHRRSFDDIYAHFKLEDKTVSEELVLLALYENNFRCKTCLEIMKIIFFIETKPNKETIYFSHYSSYYRYADIARTGKYLKKDLDLIFKKSLILKKELETQEEKLVENEK